MTGSLHTTSTKYPLTFQEISAALVRFSFPEVDAVVGIREGGVMPAGLVAHQLNLPLFFLAINFRDPQNRPRHESPRLLREPELLPADHARVLLVDDVSVSGQTFEKAVECLPGRHIQTFALKGRADFVLFPHIENCVAWPWK